MFDLYPVGNADFWGAASLQLDDNPALRDGDGALGVLQPAKVRRKPYALATRFKYRHAKDALDAPWKGAR